MFLKSSTGWKNNIVFFFKFRKKKYKINEQNRFEAFKIFSNFHNFSTIHTKTKIGLKIFVKIFFINIYIFTFEIF